MKEQSPRGPQNSLNFAQDGRSPTNKQAVYWLKRYHDNKDAQWSREVRMKDGYICRDCGELERSLLQAHHIKQKAQFPELAHNLDNGRCLCLLCHSKQHTGWPRLMILARLGLLLYQRLYPKKDLDGAFDDILGKQE